MDLGHYKWYSEPTRCLMIMVEGAQIRLKDLFESIKKYDEIFTENDERMKGMEQKIVKLEDLLIGVGQNVKNISHNMDYLMKKATDQGQSSPGVHKDENGTGKGRGDFYTPPHARNQNNGGGQVNLQTNNHSVRLKFPEFTGENPLSWIRKANRFFQIMPMGEVAKVYHSGYYMTEVADVWYMEYVEGK